MGSLIPGTGLLAAGRRTAGGCIITIMLMLGAAAAAAPFLIDPTQLAGQLVSDPNKLLTAVGAVAVLVFGWAIVVLSTHAATRRYGHLTGGQRVLAFLLVTSLIAIIGVPTVWAAQNAWLASDTIRTMFKDHAGPLTKNSRRPDTTKPDPWAGTPRVNVLLMGGDSGPDRIAIRPDTMIVASINTKTGDTALFSLPRNLQHAPFPPGSRGAEDYPDGFYCYNAAAGANTECLLNALWTWGNDHKSYYPGDTHPGLTATIQAIEQLTDLTIDEYVMLNLQGFADFVNAIDGLNLTVHQRLPIGGNGDASSPDYHKATGGWIEPGKQHLDGYHSLWYARSRWSTDDFDRMRRQRCVIGAVVQQANPAKLALGFADIMKTLQKNFLTSIPLGDVDAWVTLALRVKRAHVRSLAFTSSVINTSNPDVQKMHDLVNAAINPPLPSTTTVEPTPSTTTVKPTPSTTKKKTKKTTPPAENGQATDVTQVC